MLKCLRSSEYIDRILSPASVVDLHWFQCEPGSGSSFFTSMRIRIWIQGAKPMLIHQDLNPDPSRKSIFLHEKKHFKQGIGHKTYIHGYKSFRKAENHVYLLILVNFLAPGFESGFTFPIWIRVRIQKSLINADQCGSVSGSTTLPLPQRTVHKLLR